MPLCLASTCASTPPGVCPYLSWTGCLLVSIRGGCLITVWRRSDTRGRMDTFGGGRPVTAQGQTRTGRSSTRVFMGGSPSHELAVVGRSRVHGRPGQTDGRGGGPGRGGPTCGSDRTGLQPPPPSHYRVPPTRTRVGWEVLDYSEDGLSGRTPGPTQGWTGVVGLL